MEVQVQRSMVVGFSLHLSSETSQTMTLSTRKSAEMPRSLLSELLHSTPTDLHGSDEFTSDEDFSDDDDYDYEEEMYHEACYGQMSHSQEQLSPHDSDSAASTCSSEPINIPSSTYFKDEILRKQLYQLMHQRQLYKQHEQQQEAEARLRQQAEYKRQCKAQSQKANKADTCRSHVPVPTRHR